METTAVQKADMNPIGGKVEEVTWLVIEEATKEGGLHVAPSARAIGASVKCIRQVKDTYRGNPIVQGAIDRIVHQRGKSEAMVNEKDLEPSVVMSKVDEIPLLEAEG